MSGLFRLLFLFSSFGPLYGVLAVGLFVQHRVMSAGLAGAASLMALLVFGVLASGFEAKQSFKDKVQVEGQLDENILTYLIAYLPPLLVDDFGNPAKAVPCIGFYAVVAMMMARAETIYVNPFFLLFGYRIYRARLLSGRTVVLITRKQELAGSEELDLWEIQQSKIYYCR